MRGASAARSAAFVVVLIVRLGLAPPAAAQAWNDPRARALVEAATARRAAQIADTALAAYSATATGYLTFLGQVGEGLRLPPKILRTDQIALQVYWKAPGLSKQLIVGRRDTLLLPTDLRYHRDHLAIIQNNFPNTIRLGEGDEVKDVPHPLSSPGLTMYDFAITDSLSIHTADRTIEVYQVAVRPRDESAPRVVGALYVDKSTAQVVRMAFSFTRAAYLDKQLEDISIVLENALVEGRFWLPYRQEVEIRRSGTWLDFPARGIIRGRWEIGHYVINETIPERTFIGPEIAEVPPRQQKAYPFKGNILDSLPEEARVATDADVRRVQEEARDMIAARALAPRSGGAFFVPRLSDIARVNRVEGLALGGGGSWHATPVLTFGVLGRYGFADHGLTGRAAALWTLPSGRSITLTAERTNRDAGDVAERSLPVNSLASQEYGSDFTDPYLARSASLRVGLGSWNDVRFTALGAYEQQSALAVHATPFKGYYEPTLPAWPVNEWRAGLDADRDWVLGPASDLRVELRLLGGWLTPHDTVITGAPVRFGRAFLLADLSQAIGTHRLVLRTTAGAVTPASAPPQEQVLLGGPITGPGYGYHQFAAAFGASQHVEWRSPLPFPSVPLGAFGTTPASFTLAPYAHVIYVDRSAAFAPHAQGWYPSLGIGASFFFDLLRVDLARGLRNGGWTFGVDVTHDLWSIL